MYITFLNLYILYIYLHISLEMNVLEDKQVAFRKEGINHHSDSYKNAFLVLDFT